MPWKQVDSKSEEKDPENKFTMVHTFLTLLSAVFFRELLTGLNVFKESELQQEVRGCHSLDRLVCLLVYFLFGKDDDKSCN